jgi:TATA-box binding protein (TBP) (component of TFIID and TFIIIB)
MVNETAIPDFNLIKVSTKTIIAVSNLTFNLSLLYNYLPITEYVVVKRKRGRKKKTEIVDPNKDIPAGSIISLQNKNNVRGVVIKKKKESKTYFLNSLTVIIILENGKIINVKMSQNGKLQITGCKDNKHFMDCVKFIYKHIKETEEQIGEQLCYSKFPEENPKVIFNVVMKNIDFKIGFSIQREKLDTYINEHTKFYSSFEGSVNTGVNIKIESKNPFDPELDCLELLSADESKEYLTPYSEYIRYLDKKDKKKDVVKDKYHTFLVFCSGSVIQSGSGRDMEKVHNELVSVLLNNREHFEEKIRK